MRRTPNNISPGTAWSSAALVASAVLALGTPAQAQLGLSASSTDVSCNGGANGTGTITASGGLAPYTYSWSPSGGTNATATGLTAGTYMVYVTDQLMFTESMSVTIGQPAAISTNPTKTDVTTNGGNDGSATVAPTGGTGSFTYSWAPSGGTGATATGLTAGVYVVTVTDENNCQTQHNFTIIQPAAVPAPTVISVNVPVNGTYTTANNLDFTVNFNKVVTVSTSGGTPRLAVDVGGSSRNANYVSGSGTSALTFRYVVQAGDLDTDGISVGALSLNGGTIVNGSDNANLTLNNVGTTTGVLVSAPPPTPIPTLTEWAMILLAGLLGLFGLSQVMQRRRTV